MVDGFETRPLERFTDERGQLTETYRDDWDIFDNQPQMSYVSVTYPGIVRAWHRHLLGQTDYWVVPSGHIKAGCYDEEADDLETAVIGETNPVLIRIPGHCWHGFKAFGDKPAILVNFPSELYDHDDPDEERLAWDTDRIPLDWMEPPHE